MEIKFETDNQAFDGYGDLEVEQILSHIIDEIKVGIIFGTILDINGNKIGLWKM